MGTSQQSDWVVFMSYPDAFSADAIAGLLDSEDVPNQLEADSPVPGITHSVKVMVPSALLHRAKWVLEQHKFSDAELDYLATHTLGEEGSL